MEIETDLCLFSERNLIMEENLDRGNHTAGHLKTGQNKQVRV